MYKTAIVNLEAKLHRQELACQSTAVQITGFKHLQAQYTKLGAEDTPEEKPSKK